MIRRRAGERLLVTLAALVVVLGVWSIVTPALLDGVTVWLLVVALAAVWVAGRGGGR